MASRLRILLLAVAGLLALAVLAACQEGPLDQSTIVLGGVPVSVWVADTPAARDAGLQAVDRLEPGEGMLFAWDEPGVHEFGIKDVDYALDLIFIAQDGTVTRIASLARGGPESAGSGGPVMWALETPAGWAEASDIRVGDMLELAEDGRPTLGGE